MVVVVEHEDHLKEFGLRRTVPFRSLPLIHRLVSGGVTLFGGAQFPRPSLKAKGDFCPCHNCCLMSYLGTHRSDRADRVIDYLKGEVEVH